MRRASERIFGVVFERENMLSVSVRKYEERNIMKTTLLIMAAGIGSRFGTGIKQLEPVDASNRIIMDYSIRIVTTSRALCRKAVQSRGEPVRPCLQQRIFLAHRSS